MLEAAQTDRYIQVLPYSKEHNWHLRDIAVWHLHALLSCTFTICIVILSPLLA